MNRRFFFGATAAVMLAGPKALAELAKKQPIPWRRHSVRVNVPQDIAEIVRERMKEAELYWFNNTEEWLWT